jgi:hypothetical protein
MNGKIPGPIGERVPPQLSTTLSNVQYASEGQIVHRTIAHLGNLSSFLLSVDPSPGIDIRWLVLHPPTL